MADALGVSSMTPYRYFKDKTTSWLPSGPGLSIDSRRHGIRPLQVSIGQSLSRFRARQPAAYRLMFDVSQPTYAEYPELVRAMDRARLTMGDGLRELAAGGRFSGDVELAAYVYWSTMHGAVMLELAGLLEAVSWMPAKLRNQRSKRWEALRNLS